MNLVVAATSVLIVYKLINFNNFMDSLIASFVLFFAQIIGSELVLGASGILYLPNLIVFNLFLLLAVWFISKDKAFCFNSKGVRPVLRELAGNKLILACLSVLVGFGIVKFLVNLMNPPFGWDSLNYHFVFPAEWLKNGNLDTPITIFDDPSPSYYPINGSLIFLWFILPLKNVFLADLGQLPFFFLGFLSVFNIARKLRLKDEMALCAACLFSLIPNYFKQLSIAYVDVMVAGLFLACINYLMALSEKFNWRDCLVFSVSLGLLLGTKTIALPYSLVLFVPFVYLTLKNIEKSHFFLLSIVIAVIFGGFSYIRNFIDTGNPLYPLNMRLFGNTLFKGVMDNSVYRAHFKIEDYSLLKLLFHEGLGAQTIIFILPAAFLALPTVYFKNRRNINFLLGYFLLLPLTGYLIYRYIIPLANVRYLYAFLGIGMAAGFYTAKILNMPVKIIKVLTGICLLASISELAKRQELVWAIILTVLLWFLTPFLIKIMKKLRYSRMVFSVVIVFSVGFCLLMLLEKNYSRNEYTRYLKMVKYSGFWPDAAKAWDWLNSNTQGDNIAYAGRPVPFPLYGSGFKNNVYYVSVNGTDPAKLHYFPGSSYTWGYDFLSLHKNLEARGNYRFPADYDIWLVNLLKRDTDYLFIYSLHQTKETIFPLEDSWAGSHKEIFKQVFGNETVHIYKLIK